MNRNRPNPSKPLELSPAEAHRLVQILADGKATYRADPDGALFDLGWLRQSPDNPYLVEAIPGAAELFYDPAGCIAAGFIPEEWRTDAWEARRWKPLPLPPIDWSKPLVYDATRSTR